VPLESEENSSHALLADATFARAVQQAKILRLSS
jgi:hypothetical protein